MGYVLTSHPLETASVLMQCDVPRPRLVPLVSRSNSMNGVSLKKVYRYKLETWQSAFNRFLPLMESRDSITAWDQLC